MNNDYIQELTEKDKQQELTDCSIIALVNWVGCENDDSSGAGPRENGKKESKQKVQGS